MPRTYHRSGFYSTPLLPAPESPAGVALREKREALIADLGENPSEAQLALVDLVVAAWWQVESVTGYLLTLPSLVDKRHRRVWQVVRDRAALATSLQSMLRDLGESKPRPPKSLAQFLAEREATPTTLAAHIARRDRELEGGGGLSSGVPEKPPPMERSIRQSRRTRRAPSSPEDAAPTTTGRGTKRTAGTGATNERPSRPSPPPPAPAPPPGRDAVDMLQGKRRPEVCTPAEAKLWDELARRLTAERDEARGYASSMRADRRNRPDW